MGKRFDSTLSIRRVPTLHRKKDEPCHGSLYPFGFSFWDLEFTLSRLSKAMSRSCIQRSLSNLSCSCRPFHDGAKTTASERPPMHCTPAEISGLKGGSQALHFQSRILFWHEVHGHGVCKGANRTQPKVPDYMGPPQFLAGSRQFPCSGQNVSNQQIGHHLRTILCH